MGDDKLLADAVALYNAGRLAEAEPLFRAVLQAHPSQPAAMHLLGVICVRTGRIQEGLDRLVRSVSTRPNDAEFRRNLGTALRTAGRISEACDSYRVSLSLNQDPDTMVDLTNALLDLEQYSQAAQFARQAVQLAPTSSPARVALGSVLLGTDRLDEALIELQQAVNLDSESFQAHLRLGMALYHQARYREARESFMQANTLMPGDAGTMNQIGFTFEKENDFAEAERWFSKVVALNLQNADGLEQRANAMQRLGRLEEAVEMYERAMKQNPNMRRTGLANTLFRLSRTDEAIEHYQKMLQRHSRFPLTHMQYAMALLRKGRYQEGFVEFDWRWKCPTQHAPPRDYPQPLWRTQNITGQRVFIYPEQGFGDTILTARYLPKILELKPASLILECPDTLTDLFRRSFPEVQTVRAGDTPEFDLHAAVFDLPLIFGTTLETIPAKVPYLQADTVKAGQWKSRLGDGPEIKVGLVWGGSPINPGDRDRSMPLSVMAPLTSVGASLVRFINLQKGPAAAQLSIAPAGLKIEDYTDDLRTFDDTAALIECLDLVIAVDTSVAHLAGALARKVWIPFPFAWYWLYLERRSDSPWYPTMRLFRQTKRGDWSSPMEQIAAELTELAQSR